MADTGRSCRDGPRRAPAPPRPARPEEPERKRWLPSAHGNGRVSPKAHRSAQRGRPLPVPCHFLPARCHRVRVPCHLLPAQCHRLPASCHLLPALCHPLPAPCHPVAALLPQQLHSVVAPQYLSRKCPPAEQGPVGAITLCPGTWHSHHASKRWASCPPWGEHPVLSLGTSAGCGGLQVCRSAFPTPFLHQPRQHQPSSGLPAALSCSGQLCY